MEHYDSAMGLLTPISHVPSSLIGYSDEMTFSQRVYNVIVSGYQWYKRKYFFLPLQEEMAKEYFSRMYFHLDFHIYFTEKLEK